MAQVGLSHRQKTQRQMCARKYSHTLTAKPTPLSVFVYDSKLCTAVWLTIIFCINKGYSQIQVFL